MDIVPQLLAVLFVFALLGGSLWWLKRRGAAQISPMLPFRTGRDRTRTQMLERVDTLRLSPTHSLNLVRMANRAILIGTSPAGFHLVESTPWKTLEQQSEVQQ